MCEKRDNTTVSVDEITKNIQTAKRYLLVVETSPMNRRR